MEVKLPADLDNQVRQQVASGRCGSADALVEQAVRHLLEEHPRNSDQLESLRRVGKAGLYGRVFVPDAS